MSRMKGMRRFDPVLRQLTLANQLTLLRLVAVPCVALALLSGRPGVAFGLFVAAAVTDALDGLAARRLDAQTALGCVLDPAADKLLMMVTYILLSLVDRPTPFPEFQLTYHVPSFVTLLVVARDVIISLVAVVLSVFQKSVNLAPSKLGKATTAFVMGTAGLFLAANTWPIVPKSVLFLAAWGTATLVVASGLHYSVRMRRQLRSLE